MPCHAFLPGVCGGEWERGRSEVELEGNLHGALAISMARICDVGGGEQEETSRDQGIEDHKGLCGGVWILS